MGLLTVKEKFRCVIYSGTTLPLVPLQIRLEAAGILEEFKKRYKNYVTCVCFLLGVS